MKKVALSFRGLGFVFLAAFGVIFGWSAQAQPTILSATPPNMGTGSPTTQIIFRFSEAMNTVLTSATLMDANNLGAFIAVSQAWSTGDTVLTCTPLQPMTAGHMIIWQVDGENAVGDALSGDTAGLFTVGSTDSGCSNTNGTMESFTVAKGAFYEQSATSVPVPNTNCPYSFVSCLQLVCPHTVTSATVTPPGGTALNLPFTPVPGHPLATICGSQSALDAVYLPGTYTFNMISATSNQQVSATFPATLTAPPAPHLTNYLEAQSVDSAQPFRLGWEPFQGGTAADCIYVDLQPGFHTPAISEPGALNGTATSVTIPARTLQPNTEYSGSVTFYHYTLTTNASKIFVAYRASVTEFTLKTAGALSSPTTITNSAFGAGGAFNFDVICTPPVSLVIERKTALSEVWQPFWATNAVTAQFHVVDPTAASFSSSYYRVRTAP